MYGYTLDTMNCLPFEDIEKIDFAAILNANKDTVKEVFDSSYLKHTMENIGGEYNPIDFDQHFPDIANKTADAILYALVDDNALAPHSNDYVIGDSDYIFITLARRGTHPNDERDLYVGFALEAINVVDEIKDQVGFKGIGIVQQFC